jgi:ABC-type branched-subunit amino acid transport system permease subunit
VLTSARISGFWPALPFAIGMAMLAGLLWTPTCRLRGDYLRDRHPRLRRDHPPHRPERQLARRPAAPSARSDASDIGPLHFTGTPRRAYYYLALTFIIAIILMVRARSAARQPVVDRHP